MKDVKRLEKKHGELRRRRMEELSTNERIFEWYFNLEFEIILTPAEEQIRQILELADKIIIRYYPAFSFHKIASLLSRKIKSDLKIDRSYRQCLNYVQDAMKVFAQPVEVEKEFKKNIYINRLNLLAQKAEKEQDFAAAIKALDKAAQLENFNQGEDELVKKLMAEMEAKDITFAASKEQLEAIVAIKRKKYIENEAEDTDIISEDE